MANRSIRTKKNREAFLKALDQKKGNVSDACEAIGIGRTAAYKWKNDVESFAVEWDDVVDKHMDALEGEIYRRAFEGVDKGVYYEGELVVTEKVFSDSLAQFILKAHRPTKYRENSKIEIGGPGGGPLIIEVEYMDEKAPDQPDET
jgi:hypothetical protein